MNYKESIITKINSRDALIGIIGLGYVGLPLALTFAEKGFNVIGFDVDERKIPVLMNGQSYIKHIPSERIKSKVDSKKFKATSDFSLLSNCDAIIICVPTPLDEHLKPDLTFVENSAVTVAKYLREGQLIVLESSTYPGTTEEILLPKFSDSISSVHPERKMEVGRDFFLAFSPEREDPGNENFSTGTIPKLVGGVTENCLDVAALLYNQAISRTIPVSSAKVAEAAKLLENIYRSVNIALVNELKMVFDRMDIDVWEVIDAAKTKPFGFQAFYPGPGLGGHCIPIDPFYLTWKAEQFGINTKFIELAGAINTNMPYYVIEKTCAELEGNGKAAENVKVLILGASYKKNIDDMRESPSLKLIDILHDKKVSVDYHDPFVKVLPPTRKYKFDMKSVDLTEENLKLYDAVIISTDHDSFDLEFILKHSALIIDTRNAYGKKGIKSEKIIKA